MKTIVSYLMIAGIALMYAGCAAKATVGNRDQHGAGVAVKTKGAEKGVHATAY